MKGKLNEFDLADQGGSSLEKDRPGAEVLFFLTQSDVFVVGSVTTVIFVYLCIAKRIGLWSAFLGEVNLS